MYLSPHVTKPAALALLAALLVPVAASAQNAVAYRVGPGLQLSCGTSAPTASPSRGILWCKSTDSNKLHYTDPSASDIALGAGGSGGGASTLKLTYAAGAAAADSILALDSTRGPMILRDGASTIGNLLQVQNSGASTSYLLIAGNATQQIKSAQADGAGNVGTRVDTTTNYATGKIFQLMSNAVEKWSWQAATANMPANAVLSGASSATNTTALTMTTNVADGASSIALKVNNSAALSTAGAKLLSLQSNGVEHVAITLGALNLLNSSFTNFGFQNANGTGVVGQGSSLYLYSNNSGTLEILDFNYLRPSSDGRLALGSSAQRFSGLYNNGALSGKYTNQSGTTYTIGAGDFIVGMSSTSARTVTLPAANAFAAGQLLIVQDEANNAATNNITINRAGADTINAATSITITANSGRRLFYSDGTSKWFAQ